MKIAIIDPANHIPNLKTLFQDAEYYSHQPDDFFTYLTTHHFDNSRFYSTYGFHYRTDWETINSSNYDYVFISIPLADFYKSLCCEFSNHANRMKEKLKSIVNNNSFKMVALFDTYDYDYDPSILNNEIKVDFYFKRNYNKTKSYNSNVFPFPYIMFVKPCVLGMVLNVQQNNENSQNKINKAMWCGNLYNHVDTHNNVYRMRLEMYNEIKDLIDTYSCPENEYNQLISQYKIAVDLIGVGDPNKRTFEIIGKGTLILSMSADLSWGFENNDNFHKDTFFKTADEFKEKLHKLLNNECHYNECLQQQNKIVEKYFNKKWLRNYIETNTNIKKKTYIYCIDNGFKYFGDYINSMKKYIDFNLVLISEDFCNIDFNEENNYIFIHKIPNISFYNNIHNLKNIFVINTEQLTVEDRRNLINSYPKNINIIDYSEGNLKYIDNNFNKTMLPYQINYEEIQNTSKTKDICIIEHTPIISLKRKKILELFAEKNINVDVISGFFKERDNKLFQYKILLNISFNENYNIFESFRCDRCVYNKMIVVSDIKENSQTYYLKKYIIFEQDHQIVDRVIDILNNYQEYYEKIYSSFSLNEIEKSLNDLSKETKYILGL